MLHKCYIKLPGRGFASSAYGTVKERCPVCAWDAAFVNEVPAAVLPVPGYVYV